MALIRTKRATTAGQNGGPGQPKSKYRKRSVSRASLHILYLESLDRHTVPLLSVRHHRENAIHAIYGKRLSGGVGQTGQGLFVTHAVCVSVHPTRMTGCIIHVCG
jgi:hypothetical protein